MHCKRQAATILWPRPTTFADEHEKRSGGSLLKVVMLTRYLAFDAVFSVKTIPIVRVLSSPKPVTFHFSYWAEQLSFTGLPGIGDGLRLALTSRDQDGDP
jgi:hypothetical protein